VALSPGGPATARVKRWRWLIIAAMSVPSVSANDEATSPRFGVVLLGTRPEARTARLVTALTYERPWARVLWPPVAAVHRRVAPRLLRRARSLQRSGSPPT
jgi:hypothetical protein